MKRFLCLCVLMPVLVQACSAVPVQEPATLTPVPSDTPAPTVTPLPTETATLVPTSTPDKTATAAAQAVEISAGILVELDRLLGDSNVPYQDGHLLWKQEKPLRVTLAGPGWDYVEVDKDLVGKNFILKSDVTWEASGIIICGLTFRSEPNLERGKQYQFVYLRLSGLPAWEISVSEFGRYKNTISKVQYSDAIDQKNAAKNQVVLVAQDEQFTLYINQVRQGRYFDTSKQRMEGAFSFHGAQDSGDGTCNFEDSWVWALE